MVAKELSPDGSSTLPTFKVITQGLLALTTWAAAGTPLVPPKDADMPGGLMPALQELVPEVAALAEVAAVGEEAAPGEENAFVGVGQFGGVAALGEEAAHGEVAALPEVAPLREVVIKAE